MSTLICNIRVCNTSDQDIFVTIYLLPAGDEEVIPIYWHNNLFIEKRKTMMIPGQDIMISGDLLYAYSDFSGNTFDATVSYGQLLETA